MSVYDILKNDHRKVTELLGRIEKSTDPDDRWALFEKMRESLLSHSKAEEKVVYAKLSRDPSLEKKVEQSVREHGAIETLLIQLEDLEPDDDQFVKLVTELRGVVQHHVDDEENVVLPKARGILGDDADNKIGMAMLDEEQNQRKRDEEERGGEARP